VAELAGIGDFGLGRLGFARDLAEEGAKAMGNLMVRSSGR
jgi:hypothetical protein